MLPPIRPDIVLYFDPEGNVYDESAPDRKKLTLEVYPSYPTTAVVSDGERSSIGNYEPPSSIGPLKVWMEGRHEPLKACVMSRSKDGPMHAWEFGPLQPGDAPSAANAAYGWSRIRRHLKPSGLPERVFSASEPRRMYHQLENVDFYAPFRKILLLGDRGDFAMRAKLKQAYEDGKTIIATDISNEGATSIDVRLDNNRLPFGDDSVDAVVMKRGLCTCKIEPHTCGGIPRDKEGAQAFAMEVARVLDKNDPNAVAVLHGADQEFLRSDDKIEMWTEIGQALAEKHGMHMTIALETRDPTDPRLREFAAVILSNNPLAELELPLLESTVTFEPSA